VSQRRHQRLKAVAITDLNAEIEKQDVVVRIRFKMASSKRVFSRIRIDLYFDGKSVKSLYAGIPYYYAQRKESSVLSIISLKHIAPGKHTLKVEVSGLWHLARSADSREVTFDYYPIVKERITRAVPVIKRIEGQGVAIVTDEAKRLYKHMREYRKRELATHRDK